MLHVQDIYSAIYSIAWESCEFFKFDEQNSFINYTSYSGTSLENISVLRPPQC